MPILIRDVLKEYLEKLKWQSFAVKVFTTEAERILGALVRPSDEETEHLRLLEGIRLRKTALAEKILAAFVETRITDLAKIKLKIEEKNIFERNNDLGKAERHLVIKKKIDEARKKYVNESTAAILKNIRVGRAKLKLPVLGRRITHFAEAVYELEQARLSTITMPYEKSPIGFRKHASSLYRYVLKSSSWEDTLRSLGEPSLKNQALAETLLFQCSVLAANHPNGRFLLGNKKRFHPYLFAMIKSLVIHEDDSKNNLQRKFDEVLREYQAQKHLKILDKLVFNNKIWQSEVLDKLPEAKHQSAKNLLISISTTAARKPYFRVLAYYSHLYSILFNNISSVIQRDNYRESEQQSVALEIHNKIIKNPPPAPLKNITRKKHLHLYLLTSEKWRNQVINVVNKEQKLEAKNLLFLISKHAAKQAISLGRQEHVFDMLFKEIVRAVQSKSYLPKLRSKDAERIYKQISDKLNEETLINQRLSSRAGVFSEAPLHDFPPYTQMESHQMVQLMPRANIEDDGIEVMGVYNEKIDFNAFTAPEALPAHLKNPAVSHILFSHGTGAHWRGVHIQKPLLEKGEKKYQVKIFDSLGVGGAEYIRDEIKGLLIKSGLREEEIYLKGLNLHGLVETQNNSVSCGQYTKCFEHYTVQTIKPDSKNYHKPLAIAFHHEGIAGTQEGVTQAVHQYSREKLQNRNAHQVFAYNRGIEVYNNKLASPITDFAESNYGQTKSAINDLRSRCDIKVAYDAVYQLRLNAANSWFFDWGSTAKAASLKVALDNYVERAAKDETVRSKRVYQDEAVAKAIDSYRYFGFFNRLCGKKTSTRKRIEKSVFEAAVTMPN